MKWLYFMMLCLLSSSWAWGQQLVIDKRAIEQVGKNTLAVLEAEQSIQKSFASARESQEKISKYTALVQLHLERIDKAKRDVSAFQKTSKNFQLIQLHIKAILQELKLLPALIRQNPLGTAAYSKAIIDIGQQIVSIGSTFISTIADGTVEIDGIPYGSKYANLIDPVQRLALVNRCIYDLQLIRQYLYNIRINIQMRNSLRRASIALFPSATLSYDKIHQIKNDIINLWIK